MSTAVSVFGWAFVCECVHGKSADKSFSEISRSRDGEAAAAEAGTPVDKTEDTHLTVWMWMCVCVGDIG